MTTADALSASVLRIDTAEVAGRIELSIRDSLRHRLRRRGIVVGLSGGVDSSVVGALAARALGPDRVIGLLMPEADSSPESTRLAQTLVGTLGIMSVVEDISGVLAAAGCYRRRDEAIRTVISEYADGYRCKIVLPDLISRPGYQIFSIVVLAPSGEERRVRLPLNAYLGIVCLYAKNHRIPSEAAADAVGLTLEQVARA